MIKNFIYGFLIIIFSVSQGLGQWMDSSEGLTPNTYTNHEGAYSVIRNSTTIYATTFHSVFYSTDGGSNWIEMTNGLPSDPDIGEIACNESTVLVQTKVNDNGRGKYDVFRWDGNTWIDVIPKGAGLAYKVTALVSSGTTWYCRAASDLLKSTDDGMTWTVINSQIDPGNLPSNSHYMAYRNGKLFLGGQIGTVARNVYVSDDDGQSWNQVDGIQGSYFHQTENAIYTVCDSIFKSTDDGATWNVIHSPLHSLDLWTSGDTLVEVMDAGYGCAYFSTDDGENWNPYNDGIPDGTPSPGLRSIITYNGKFITGVSGVPLFTSAGIYERDIDFSPTDVKKETGIPKGFDLSQNYPNPFNPSTKIKFSIQQNSLVTLTVYDDLGRKVAELVNEELPQGEYSTNFDSKNLASGVYYYRLTTDDFVETKKMLLLR